MSSCVGEVVGGARCADGAGVDGTTGRSDAGTTDEVALGPRADEGPDVDGTPEPAQPVIRSRALSTGLHRQARMAALDLNWILAEVARGALDEWLVRHKSELAGTIGGRR